MAALSVASASRALSSLSLRPEKTRRSSFVGTQLSCPSLVSSPSGNGQIVASKQLKGRVVQNVADKTASVLVMRILTHPRYRKQIKRSKKYPAHDPENLCEIGDLVTLKLCRPISKTKRFLVTEVNGQPTNAEKIIELELDEKKGIFS